MSYLKCFIKVASNNGDTFSNVATCDLLIYTESNSQDIHFGVTVNSNSVLLLTSNNTYINTSVTCSGNMTVPNLSAQVLNVPNYSDVGNTGMFKNRVINGDMRINQREIYSLTTGAGVSNGVFMIDRFSTSTSITTGATTQSNITLTSNDTPYTYGFRRSWRTTASTACTNYQYVDCLHYIEGCDMEDMNWGTSFGSPVTLSMWMKTNVAANSKIPFTLHNYALTHSCVADVTVASSCNWQYVTQTFVAPPSNSTWSTSSNLALAISMGSYGSNHPYDFRTPTSNAWVASNVISTTASTYIWGTLNNYIEITGVQLEKGNIPTNFEFRPYAIELEMCQRYLYKMRTTADTWYTTHGSVSTTSSSTATAYINLPVPMRSSLVTLATTQGSGSTITMTGTPSNDMYYCYVSGVDRGFTSASVSNLPPNNSIANITLTGGTGLTAGQCGQLITHSNKICYVAISSEV